MNFSAGNLDGWPEKESLPIIRALIYTSDSLNFSTDAWDKIFPPSFQSSFRRIPAEFARQRYFRAWRKHKWTRFCHSLDPFVIPPFLFASCTRARKKNIGGTRSDATETLPRGKFRPGWSGKWENAGIIRRGMERSRDWPDGLSFKSGGPGSTYFRKL